MICLKAVSKSFVQRGTTTVVADRINATFPSRTPVALLGRNGAGKSSLLRMIAGTMLPDSGQIIASGTVSWPVGFAGSFHGDLTGLQNTRFIARVYGIDSDNLAEAVHDMSELGKHFYLPVGTYSSGMRSRLAFAISMGIDFDTYLVDEITSVGDAAFKQRSERIFAERLTRSGAIIATHALGMVKRLCLHGAVLEAGKLTYYDNVDEAIQHHQAVMTMPA
ncbi:ATP-binding cassette domain-containing protein [Defluviimonas aestuarii]|uniref:ABC transporter ATP-binding protein n=1 Tax=Albidovulum aestuarii TaxID=1130726 RepID=UPI00249C9C98|nr:ATP-binding cassette domain-containing protein [Defluviimonas aestuarii]MDI3336886.1 ATP-binding cassette domain-containing protein [Defluviimonas aestuarii]